MRVGSLVECISKIERDPNEYSGVVYPEVGNIYTVRSIVRRKGIRLEEIVNPTGLYVHNGKVSKTERGFNMSYFREIQPPMTINISELIEENEPALWASSRS